MHPKTKNTWHPLLRGLTTLSLSALAVGLPAVAQEPGFQLNLPFFPGNLVVTRSVYDNKASNVKVGQILPPNCVASSGNCVTATNNGTYPAVFNNVLADANFGLASTIYLDQLTPSGFLLNSLEVPNSAQRGARPQSNQLVTSFSSKSELALHLSTDGRFLTFVGYVAPIDAIDASNANTPGVVDPTNPDSETVFRAVAAVNSFGQFTFTETNAYSGDNGRSAILNNSNGANVFYASGNAGNGSNPQPDGVILGTGAQFIEPTATPESFQTPGTPIPLASFSVTELGDKIDKVGKDDNFRGMTLFNNVLYFTKGSGSNGVNTVYFVDTTGTACPKGVGVPAVGAPLPVSPLATGSLANLQTTGLPSNMCILSGFPTVLAKSTSSVNFPFGLFFADANTLYVADEGDGFSSDTTLFTHAAAQATAGLEKWIFDATTQTWNLAYTLQNGLELGVPYTVDHYPTGNNSATSLPWSPATDGLRNLTGSVDRFGKVTLYAITSTVSGGGDQGADPNRLVAITDTIQNTTAASAANEKFTIVRKADFAEVLRGVSFAPSEQEPEHHFGW
jgi:hypothetical protein